MNIIGKFNPAATTGNVIRPTEYPCVLTFTNLSNVAITVVISTQIQFYLGARDRTSILLDERMNWSPTLPVTWIPDVASITSPTDYSYLVIEQASPVEFQHLHHFSAALAING